MSKAKLAATCVYRVALLAALVFIGARLHTLVEHETDGRPPYVRVSGPVEVTNESRYWTTADGEARSTPKSLRVRSID